LDILSEDKIAGLILEGLWFGVMYNKAVIHQALAQGDRILSCEIQIGLEPGYQFRCNKTMMILAQVVFPVLHLNTAQWISQLSYQITSRIHWSTGEKGLNLGMRVLTGLTGLKAVELSLAVDVASLAQEVNDEPMIEQRLRQLKEALSCEMVPLSAVVRQPIEPLGAAEAAQLL